MTTVLFLHPVPGSGFDPDPAVTAAAGIHLLAPNRPGYGDAPPLPAGVVPDLPAVTARLAPPERVDLVVGWSGGGHYALALAALHPDLVGRVALVGTPAPDEAVPWIPDELRPATEAMRADPPNALAMVLEALDGSASPELDAGGPADEALLAADGALADRLDAMLATAFAQGPVGLAIDLVAQHISPWGFDPADVAQPVTLVYGSEDPIVGVEHGRYWDAMLPDAELVVATAGHLVVVDAWRRLLTR